MKEIVDTSLTEFYLSSYKSSVSTGRAADVASWGGNLLDISLYIEGRYGYHKVASSFIYHLFNE